jgi:hypothetical protein
MDPCDSKRCERCGVDVGSATCLRRNAQSCIQVAKALSGRAREGMELLSFNLMDEASAIERERTVQLVEKTLTDNPLLGVVCRRRNDPNQDDGSLPDTDRARGSIAASRAKSLLPR